MPSQYALSVSLTEHLCTFINRQIDCGRYRTASEVVRTALRLLEQQAADPPSAGPGRDQAADIGSNSRDTMAPDEKHAQTRRRAS